MTSEAYANIPSFPDDVLTAPLLRLSLQKLLNADQDESDRLFSASKDIGFFYLDLRGTPDGDSILEDANRLFGVGEELLSLSVEEKQEYDFKEKESYFGYKGYATSVIDKEGTLDRNEFYNVSKDDILSISNPLPAPAILSNARPIMKSYILSAHSIVSLILEHLNKHLHLPNSTLANIHRLHAVAGDQIRFIKSPPQPVDNRQTALGEHTDFGSITILFNRLGGLQVLPPGKGAEWCYVRPIPGHAIVNLGDAMVKFTNGLLRSNIHRVVSPPGAQADSTRYSLAYFARPEDEVILKRLEGSDVVPPLAEGEVEEEVSSRDWIVRRAIGKRVGVYKGPEDWEKGRGTEVLSQRSSL
ncbi:MAG: hypothetical protein M1827_004772 [Pycnora praestabilis]|nr:MAG: hypothetical protein M1827_004772 [Pycnora praestabilis]